MAIVLESSAQANGSDTAPTFTKPASIANTEVLVVVFGIRGPQTVTASPTGWVLFSSQIGGTNARVYAYYKVLTDAAGEPATYAWTIGAIDQWAGGILRYSGVDNTTPEDVADATATGTSTAPAVGAISTATDGAQVLAFIAIDATTSTTITVNDVLVTERWNTTTQIANEFDDGPLATAGTTGVIDWTLSASREWACLLMALRPAATTQFARPDADVTDGAWLSQTGSNVALFTPLSEAVLNEANYAESSASPSSADVVEVGLGNITP